MVPLSIPPIGLAICIDRLVTFLPPRR